MKKMNKKGFTLVEIMIVVAIIGLLAAIGIPSILKAYQTSQENTMKRNVADVEKAKGQLTLPTDSVKGAMAATETTLLTDGNPGLTNLLAVLQISDLNALDVGTNKLVLGTMSTKAHY